MEDATILTPSGAFAGRSWPPEASRLLRRCETRGHTCWVWADFVLPREALSLCEAAHLGRFWTRSCFGLTAGLAAVDARRRRWSM